MLNPYRPGRIFCFCLVTSKKLPLIVHQDERSRIAPYGPAQKPKELKGEINKKIFESVNNFLKNKDSNLKTLQVVGELDNFFVVECFDPNGFTKAVRVDKNTSGVNWIPVPFGEK